MKKNLSSNIREELASINHENDNSNHFKTMIFASYTELSELKNKSILRSCNDLKNLYSFHIEQKLIEQDLKQKIPSFLKLKDKTSGAVQSQYEENPYPRWESIHIPEKSVCWAIGFALIHADFKIQKLQKLNTRRFLLQVLELANSQLDLL